MIEAIVISMIVSDLVGQVVAWLILRGERQQHVDTRADGGDGGFLLSRVLGRHGD
jgi:hypothetical protein